MAFANQKRESCFFLVQTKDVEKVLKEVLAIFLGNSKVGNFI